MSDVEFYPEQRVFNRPTAVDIPKLAECARLALVLIADRSHPPGHATAAPFARLRPSSHTVTSDFDAPPRASPLLSPTSPQIISASGDGMWPTVKVDGGAGARRAPRARGPDWRFDDGERVLYNPDGKIETSRKDKTRPKGIVAVVTHGTSLVAPDVHDHRGGQDGTQGDGGAARRRVFRPRLPGHAVARALVEREEAERREREAAAAAKAAKAEAKRRERETAFMEAEAVEGARSAQGGRRSRASRPPRPSIRRPRSEASSPPRRVRERFRDGGREGKLG